ncbi:MAG: DUF445 family protein [Spirochaetales bacterium]|nr:DUF445 family protein [Spirochaetales bacterium]
MNFFITWILPPIIGAFIGYTTNKIAISMIFKPYKEIRIFKKIRVPFTPGLIPKERYELASNIGEMVEKELLTPEVICSKLNSPEIQNSVSKFLKETATQSIPKIYPSAVENIFEALTEESIFEKICEAVEKEIFKYLSSLGGMASMMITASGFGQKLTAEIPGKLLEIIETSKEKALERENSEKIIGILQTKKDTIDFDSISKGLSKKIEAEITEIMKILNIKGLVEDRINSLEIKEVEKILLMIIKKHLKWINIFGALLGSMIGVAQILLNLTK